MASPSATDKPSAESTTSEPVDLTSSPQSLHRAVYTRRAEYIRPHRIRVKIGTWNVAACPGTDKDLASWFVSGRGIDKRLASLDLANNPAVETQPMPDSADDDDPNAVRLVGGNKIGLYVLGLQEVMDLNVATQYVSRVYTADPGPMEKWKVALEAAMPEGYQLVTSEQLSGLLLLIYASPDVVPTISNTSTVTVGTGLLGYLGNKGAVTSRIVLGESTRMVFVNSHLASGNDASYLERRIWDVGQILARTQFEPVSHGGITTGEPEKIGDEDFAFWFGDLNFRLDGLPGDDIRRLLTLHTRGEYDLSKKASARSLDGEGIIVMRRSGSSDDLTDQESPPTHSANQSFDEASATLHDPDDFLPDPHEDPGSLQSTLDSLLPHDQLRRMMRQRKVFHDGWREGPITFLPSYKYDIGTVGLFDSSEKRRAPSWCDRILFRTRKDKVAYDKKIKEEEEARMRDEDMKARGMESAGDDDEVLFDYDPDKDGEGEPQGSVGYDYDEYDDESNESRAEVETKEGFLDRIHLDIYTSHQRITSSDHKPVISVFTLDYDGAVPELKAKVHADVARELDRAENEGRPGITIVVDGQESVATSTPEDRAGRTVDFGDVEYLGRKTCALTLANTGQVPATFSFVEKPTTEELDGYAPAQWLTTSFARSDGGDSEVVVDLGREVTLEPGETVGAVLEVHVDDIALARLLNDGQEILEDVLVLRVDEGRDHFIPVRANWLPTCMGRSIEELIRVPDGGIRSFVRSLPRSQGKDRPGSIPYDLEVRWSAPKELFKLTEAVEALTERTLADEQMLEVHEIPKDAGWPFEGRTWKFAGKDSTSIQRSKLIEALDNDTPLIGAFVPEIPSIERLEVVCEVFLHFLRSLTDGIITLQLWARIEQAPLPSLGQGAANPARPLSEDNAEDDKTTILDVLASAPNHNIAFVFLTTTLTKIISELCPLTKADLDALKASGRGFGSLGKRSISFRRSGGAPPAETLAALERRQARERRFAEIFSKVVCRASVPSKERDRKLVEDKQRAVLELFLKKRENSS